MLPPAATGSHPAMWPGQIVNALAGGDGERAELIMKEHVFEARDLLVARLRAEENAPAAEARA